MSAQKLVEADDPLLTRTDPVAAAREHVATRALHDEARGRPEPPPYRVLDDPEEEL